MPKDGRDFLEMITIRLEMKTGTRSAQPCWAFSFSFGRISS